jgi:hypothetical protein
VLLIALGSLQTQVKAVSDDAAPVIDNERVTVWDITLTPGEPRSFERHDNDFVTMFLVGGKIRTTDAGGRSTVALREAGDATFGPKGAQEKEEVISHSPARLIVVELKDYLVSPLMNNTGYPLAFPRPGSKKVLDNDRVTVWNYTWTLGVPVPMHYHDKDVVVVYRDNGLLKSTTPNGESVVNDDKLGMVRFNKRDRVHFEELVKGEQSAIVLELK